MFLADHQPPAVSNAVTLNFSILPVTTPIISTQPPLKAFLSMVLLTGKPFVEMIFFFFFAVPLVTSYFKLIPLS